jgi:DNA-binding NtrC family response regulator
MQKLKVLVVEDDAVTLNVLEKRLIDEGYEVETAQNGTDGVAALSRRCFDVVLTDVKMPGETDGIGVLEETKARGEGAEVIVMTAHATVDNAVEAMKKGAIDYLQKPVNYDELMLRLERIKAEKSLVKDVIDLRDAMSQTEKNASQTINDLEIAAAKLKESNTFARDLLSAEDLDANDRIRRAIELLSSPTGS